MKNILVALLLLVITTSNAFAANPSIFIEDYNQAVAVSKQRGIPLLLIFTIDNCQACNNLKSNLPEVEDVVICYLPLRKNRAIFKNFNAGPFPDSRLIDGLTGKEIKRLVGFKTSNLYRKWLAGE